MASPLGYRSPRNPGRFRVLTDSVPVGKFHVCEGLARPQRKALWRLVASVDTYEAATSVRVDRSLGWAVIPAECIEVDFVDAAGRVLG